jgi:hypothetical protein
MTNATKNNARRTQPRPPSATKEKHDQTMKNNMRNIARPRP